MPWDFRLFPKLKSPFKGKGFQTVNEIQENMMGQLMVIGRTVWGPKVPTLKGTEASLSYVQCFLYLVSSSINISIFHSTWLDTFWTDLISCEMCAFVQLHSYISFYWCKKRIENGDCNVMHLMAPQNTPEVFYYLSISITMFFCLFPDFWFKEDIKALSAVGFRVQHSWHFLCAKYKRAT